MNPFWDFSLALYAQEGVAPLCLALQDQHKLDVNLLLYTVFAASCGIALSPSELSAVDASVADWRDTLVRPQRALRRRVDRDLEPQARQALLDAELALERVQQERMWAARRPPGDWQAPGQTPKLRDNLAALAAFTEIDVTEMEALASALEHLLPLLQAQR